MGRLTLDLDHLQVESFATGDSGAIGTVLANQEESDQTVGTCCGCETVERCLVIGTGTVGGGGGGATQFCTPNCTAGNGYTCQPGCVDTAQQANSCGASPCGATRNNAATCGPDVCPFTCANCPATHCPTGCV
jgi:hypothetical protein